MQAIITLLDIPGQKAVVGSSFTPMLGQYGVGIREFCNVFNLQTKDFSPELPFNLSVYVESRDKFSISKLKINPNFIVKVLSYNVKNLSLKNIYIGFIIMQKFGSYASLMNLKSNFKIYLSYIKSFNIRIIS